MAKFHLLAGGYDAPDMSKPASPEGRRPIVHINAPAVVESDRDLVQYHGADKFSYVDPGDRGTFNAPAQNYFPQGRPNELPKGGVIGVSETVADDYDGLTKEELRAKIEERELDVPTGASKAEMLQALRG